MHPSAPHIGTTSVNSGARATFKICRWEHNGTNSRTRLDITLANTTYDDISVMSIRSDGRVGIGITNPSETLDIGAGNFKTTGIVYTPTLTNAGNIVQMYLLQAH